MVKEIEKEIHIAIFELKTEEESVLTISKFLTETGIKVSLFLSKRIWDLLKGSIEKDEIEFLKIYNNESSFIDLKNELIEDIKRNKIRLIIFPHFSSYSFKETKLYINFFRNYKTLVGVFNYPRWFSTFPPIKFNGVKIIKFRAIEDWIYCHMVKRNIYSFFVSDIHVNSNNPLKKYLKKYVKDDKILDIPFKVNHEDYNPCINYEYPVFVIPGRIEKSRRKYAPVMNFFRDPKLRKYRWKLILLGTPTGKYGQKILKLARIINSEYEEERIIYFNKYVERSKYEQFMRMSSHIIAPINEKGYIKGKDSGAIYDVFKYNKIGIFNDKYFYNSSLIEKKVILTYKNLDELYNILYKIILKKINYDFINKYKDIVNNNINYMIYRTKLHDSVIRLINNK